MKTLNLGILAHVDAGKTSLTERLLHGAGVIDEIGSVDDGNTQTDSLALERQRGITIKSAVVSFAIGDVTVNLIDTPGHPDFIAEVERVLSVLDGAVLVISAVEGVQPQTRVLMRTLQRLRIPTLIFVNKIDRGGARPGGVLRDIAAKLTPSVVAMGSTSEPGTRAARYLPRGETDIASLRDTLVEHDDELLAAFVADESALTPARLRGELAAQTKRALVHPVFFGSAITGAGVDDLTAGITELLPAAGNAGEDAAGAPVSGTVFKVERGPAGEKIAYVRLFSGTVRVRDRVSFGRGTTRDTEEKITAIDVFEAGSARAAPYVTAGRIGKLRGPVGVQIGDSIGVPPHDAKRHHFAPPTLETVVVPGPSADKGALHLALAQLAEQDPLINLRQDDIRQELYLSLYGEVQKEVIEATLADEFGVEVSFRETTTICVERVAGTGEAVERMKQGLNPFLATVGLRVEPAPVGTGIRFALGIELGALPTAFINAIEETVHETLRYGLHGWQVPDGVVTLTYSGYAPRQGKRGVTFDPSISSSAGDFRHLTPLVLMAALKAAGTTVWEPMHAFRLEIPADLLGPVLPALSRLGAVPRPPVPRGDSCVLEGEIPAARVYELQQSLPGLTRGEGVLDCAFDRYERVRGAVPARPRSDHNPLNRKEYLLHVQRRV